MSTNLCIWQEAQDKTMFRFQTDDENIHFILSQRNDFKLVGWGLNVNLWIYLGKFNSLREAQHTLRIIMHRD
jgi:hypothetical protein